MSDRIIIGPDGRKYITNEPLLHEDKQAAELRRLHTELERKSDAIQRLWKERDELRALNAELVEALRQAEGIIKLNPHALSITRTALMKAKLEYENEAR